MIYQILNNDCTRMVNWNYAPIVFWLKLNDNIHAPQSYKLPLTSVQYPLWVWCTLTCLIIPLLSILNFQGSDWSLHGVFQESWPAGAMHCGSSGKARQAPKRWWRSPGHVALSRNSCHQQVDWRQVSLWGHNDTGWHILIIIVFLNDFPYTLPLQLTIQLILELDGWTGSWRINRCYPMVGKRDKGHWSVAIAIGMDMQIFRPFSAANYCQYAVFWGPIRSNITNKSTENKSKMWDEVYNNSKLGPAPVVWPYHELVQ